jgi:hypothetical protein
MKRKIKVRKKKRILSVKRILTGINLKYIVYMYKGKLYQHKFKKGGKTVIGRNSLAFYFPYELKYSDQRGFLN